jgi:hypothetical protein
MCRMLLFCDNGMLYTSESITEAITSFGWIMLQHPLYSRDLPSLFGPLGVGKEACEDAITPVIGRGRTLCRWLQRREAACAGWK